LGERKKKLGKGLKKRPPNRESATDMIKRDAVKEGKVM